MLLLLHSPYTHERKTLGNKIITTTSIYIIGLHNFGSSISIICVATQRGLPYFYKYFNSMHVWIDVKIRESLDNEKLR